MGELGDMCIMAYNLFKNKLSEAVKGGFFSLIKTIIWW